MQRGGSYKTQINWDALFDENGKLKLSLGLFAPDTITSLGATGEDYHENENIFFTGYQGDPTKQKPSDKIGMAWPISLRIRRLLQAVILIVPLIQGTGKNGL